MKKRICGLFLAISLVAGLVMGCSGAQGKSENSDGEKVYKIGVCVANFETPMQVAWMNALEDKLNEYGNYEVDNKDGKDDPATQTQILENFITQQKDLIVLAPTQTDALVAAVKECNNAGIPVVTINRSLGEGAEVLTEVNMDCVEAGKMAAEMVEELLGGEGKIAYLLGTLGAGPQVQESEGFYAYLEDKPELEVVFEQNSDWNKEKAIQVTQNLLQKYPAGEIDAIVCQGPDDAVGAVAACEAAGRTELLGKIIAFDYPEYVKTAIKDGTIYGTINQDPKLQGQLAAEVINEYFTNPDAQFEPLTAMDLSKVTADNADDYEVAW